MTDQPMDAAQAQDHLQMVDRILSRVDEPICLDGGPYIVWGVVGGGTDIVTQTIVSHNGAPSLLWISLTLMVLAVSFMVYYGIRLSRKERRGLLGRHIGTVFMISWLVSLIVMIFAPRIFSDWAQAALWNVMFGAGMMYVGSLARSRVSFGGGVIVVAAILVANLFTPYAGYVLAAGFIVGMGGAGVVLTLARGNE